MRQISEKLWCKLYKKLKPNASLLRLVFKIMQHGIIKSLPTQPLPTRMKSSLPLHKKPELAVFLASSLWASSGPQVFLYADDVTLYSANSTEQTHGASIDPLGPHSGGGGGGRRARFPISMSQTFQLCIIPAID